MSLTKQILFQKLDKQYLRGLGYVERLPDDRTVKKVLKNIQEGKKFSWKAKKDIDN